MKKLLSLLIVFLSISIASCNSDDDEWFTDIKIDTEYNFQIDSFAWNVYRVDFPTAGTYTIRLTNLGSDCGATYCTNDENAESADDLVDNIDTVIDDHIGNSSDEIGTITVTQAGYGFIVVDEFDHVDSHFDLKIESGDTMTLSMQEVVNADITSNKKVNIRNKWLGK